jgi:CMP-N-acetylneuraminic acid synthetase
LNFQGGRIILTPAHPPARRLQLKRQHADILAVIPARAGSQGIANKNIQLLHGKPLLAYSIEAALRARLISRVIVSTESEAIAAVAREHGAEVPFLRPPGLAGHRSSISEALAHVLGRLDERGEKPFACTVLYPTHPFRTPALVNLMAGKLLAGYGSALTVKPLAVTRATFYVRKNDALAPLPDTAVPCGAVARHCYRPYGLVEAYVVRQTPRPRFYQPVHDPVALIDIDFPEDLRLAEEVLRRGLFDFTATDADHAADSHTPAV